MDKTTKERLIKLATYFFDLSKLCFTGLVVGIIVILSTDYSNVIMWGMLILGISSTTAFALIGNKILKKE